MKLGQLKILSWVIFLANTLDDLEDWDLTPGLFNLPTYHNLSKMKYDEFVAFYLFWRSALNSKRHLIKDKKTHYPLIKIIKEPEAVAQ